MIQSAHAPQTARSFEISDQEVLYEIGSMGAGHASTALSAVLHEKVTIEVPRVHTNQSNFVSTIYRNSDAPVLAVLMQLRDNVGCDVALVFDAEEAKKIAVLMASSAQTEAQNDEIESSAIEELGSIMISSFLNALANFTGTNLVPKPPELLSGSFSIVMDKLLAKNDPNDVATVFNAQFKRSTGSAEGYLIMLPCAKLRTMLAEKGKAWLS